MKSILHLLFFQKLSLVRGYVAKPGQLTANQRFCYSDFVAVISPLSKGLGKKALGIVKIYLGSSF